MEAGRRFCQAARRKLLRRVVTDGTICANSSSRAPTVLRMVFGSVGAAFGYYAVFLSNAAMLAGGGWLMRKAEVPMARPK